MFEELPIPTLNPLLAPLPPKFHELYDHQIPPIMEIVEAFQAGEKVVVVEAPTGTGKTIMAEVVRLMLGSRGVYLCHNKDLQDQFANDFPYSRVMKGRSNYEPEYAGLFNGATCEDCQSEGCLLCSSKEKCSYVVAKAEAAAAPVAVLNSAYWLNETLGRGSVFRGRGLCVIDEADTLEGVLMSQVSIYISPWAQREYGIKPPGKMTKESSYVSWGEEALDRILSSLQKWRSADRQDIRVNRRVRYLSGLVSQVRTMVDSIKSQECSWVYTGGAGSGRRKGEVVEFRPVEVGKFGGERVWKNGTRFLLMSGSVVSGKMLVEGLGWDLPFKMIGVDSVFPAKNRPVVVRPCGNMSRGERENGFKGLARGISELVGGTEDRTVIHTVSYSLAKDISGHLSKGTGASGRHSRRILSYGMGSERASVLSEYRRTPGAILVAPSADRGLDLAGDLARLQIIAKVPYPNLGDQQVQKRLYSTGNGQMWYAVQTARTIMQMVGRGVRGVDDWCECWILDSSFPKWYSQWQTLFPRWFRQAVRFER
jgi:Rad3-related DNA helicase